MRLVVIALVLGFAPTLAFFTLRDHGSPRVSRVEAEGEGKMTLWLDIAPAMLAVGAALFWLSQPSGKRQNEEQSRWANPTVGERTMTTGPFEGSDLVIATIAGVLAWTITFALRVVFGA